MCKLHMCFIIVGMLSIEVCTILGRWKVWGCGDNLTLLQVGGGGRLCPQHKYSSVLNRRTGMFEEKFPPEQSYFGLQIY